MYDTRLSLIMDWWWLIVIIAAVILIILYYEKVQRLIRFLRLPLAYLKREHRESKKKEQEARNKRKVERAEPVGRYLGAFAVNTFYRIGVSALAAIAIMVVIFVIDHVFGAGLLPWWGAMGATLLLLLIFALNDEFDAKGTGKEKYLKVPAKYVAILTFFGRRLNVYLEEGDYYWFGAKLGFGVSTEKLQNRAAYGYEASHGYVFVGDRTMLIWSNMNEKGQTRLTAVSGDGSDQTATLTLTFKVYWPMQWADADDPIQNLADRARSGLRTIASFLPTFDNIKMQTIFSGLMGGGTLITALTEERVDIYDRGSVIQDRSGRHIFKLIPYASGREPAEFKALRDLKRKEVENEIKANGWPKMLEAVKNDEDGTFLVQEFSLNRDSDPDHNDVNRHIIPVLNDCGCHLEYATVGEILQSDEVQKQANKASGEAFERLGQRMNAASMQENTKTMKKGLTGKGGEAALAASLAADGKGSFIYVSGDRLTRAAVAGAKTLGDGK